MRNLGSEVSDLIPGSSDAWLVHHLLLLLLRLRTTLLSSFIGYKQLKACDSTHFYSLQDVIDVQALLKSWGNWGICGGFVFTNGEAGEVGSLEAE